MWESDKLGRVGVEFVIGGKNPKNGNDSYDGRIVKAFPDGGQAYHLGNTKSKFMNEHSVGVELCNFGYLTNEGRTYTGLKVQDEQIVTLKEPFRGYTKWHAYTNQQLAALRRLILYIANRDNIDVREGLIQRIKKDRSTAFDYDEKIASGKIKGMFSHGNVRKDKFDVSPQDSLIDMLMTL
jgi:N-acetyl-anhydromuramyl-L-alanine amidase AmpD